MKAKVLKPLLLSAAAILLVVATVLATMSYLTSSSAVSNVFTVGDVGIQMFESKVNSDGEIIEEVPGTKTADTNSYHLVPSKTYVKDPTVYVRAESTPSYLFVRLRNDLKAIEKQDDAEHPTIVQQLEKNGWFEIHRDPSNVDAVFVYAGPRTDWETSKAIPKLDLLGNEVKDEHGDTVMVDAPKAVTVGSAAAESYDVFNTFTLANEIPNLSTYGGARVAIVAYAIQADIDTKAEDLSYDAYMDAWEYIKNELPFVV